MLQTPYYNEMLSLVRLVGQHPVLWDINHVFYKNVKKTDEAWCAVAGRLKSNKECCRRKWTRLRNSFLRMLTPDGKLCVNRIRFNATLYENMKFLLPVISRKIAKDANKENVNKENDTKKIPQIIKSSIQENQKLISQTREIVKSIFYEPAICYNFGVTDTFSHWPTTLCTPAVQLNWTTPLEKIVANASASSKQKNKDCLLDALKKVYAICENEKGKLEQLEQLKQLDSDKTKKEVKEIYPECQIQEAFSYFR